MKNEAFPEEDYISQLETSEGNTLYTISRLKTHATDIKTYFNFGHIIIFEQGKKNGYYKGDLISLECLNQHMEWTQDYFKKIRACLLEPKKDVGYSFIVDKDYSEDEAKFFKIIFKISKTAEIVGVNIKCDFVSTNLVMETLMKEIIAVNNTKMKKIESQNKAVKNMETEKLIILENMNDIAQAKEQSETELIEKFTVLLNEKKKKLMALQQQLDQRRSIQAVDPNRTQGTSSLTYTMDSESLASLPMYQFGGEGSQMNWIKLKSNQNKENNCSSKPLSLKETQSLSVSETQSLSVKEEPVENIKKKVHQTKILKTSLSLSDLF